MKDPRKAKTLGEACDNGNGTYNGIKALAWLSEVLNPGKGLSVEEIRKIAEEVVQKKKKERGGKSEPGKS